MTQANNNGITLRISWMVIALALVATNVLTLLLWQPWKDDASATRKITVSGEATIDEVPDEYVMSPYFEFADPDRVKATQELTILSGAITAKLKELGVDEKAVKSTTTGYERYSPTPIDNNSANTLQLQYTITLSNKELAQKVQDYFLTLKPKGQISPIASFSETKRKQLEDQVRSKAIDDAKAKAEKTAAQLNAKLGRAINISDGAGYGTPMPMMGVMEGGDMAVSSVPIQEGQNKFSYSVSVEYELK